MAMDLSILAKVCERIFSWIAVQSAIFPSRKKGSICLAMASKDRCRCDKIWSLLDDSWNWWIYFVCWTVNFTLDLEAYSSWPSPKGIYWICIVPIGALHKVTTVLFARFRLAQSSGDFLFGWIAALVRFSYFTNDVSEGSSILGLGSEMSIYEQFFDLIPSSRGMWFYSTKRHIWVSMQE